MRILIYLLFISICFKINSQQNSNSQFIELESLLVQQESYIKNIYKSEIYHDHSFINGREYKIYYYLKKSNPLFNAYQNNNSSIKISNKIYNDIELGYDMYKDELIYRNTNLLIENRYPFIVLNNDLINEFTLRYELDTFYFRNISFNHDIHPNMNDGYYEIAYENKSSFLIKHTAYVVDIDGKDLYDYKQNKYIIVNGLYLRIITKRAFIKAFGDKAGLVKKYIQSNKYKIRKITKNQVIDILYYHDSL